jgi:multicomponent Na+:H+ antiporter subunit E
MSADGPSPVSGQPSMARRVAGFMVLWLIIMGPGLKDLPMGLLASLAASWVSLRLWPTGSGLSLGDILSFVLRFLPQSVTAGVGVARLAFFPGDGLRPGLATYRTRVPAGMARRGFCAVMSLQPGKLPIADGQGDTLTIHCLDREAPVAEEIAADERAFLALIRRGHRHG